MLWFGSSPRGGMMWSIVQSSPSKSLWHPIQIGSSMVLAYALAFVHALLLCHSLIV
jgi:hypothetical protein